MLKELRLPDPASWSLKWNSIIHVNQRSRLPNEVKAKRETCKSAENMHAPYNMATAEEKQILQVDTHPGKIGMTNEFLREYSRD